MSDSTIEAAINELKGMPIREIRKNAANLYGVHVTKEMTEEDIFNAIRVRAEGSDFAVKAKGDMPRPGWARIVIQKVSGQSNRPLIFSVNRYRCSVPRGVEVDVPIKVYRSIRNCKRKEYILDEGEAINSPNRMRWEVMDVYPMTLVAITEGPDPRPNHERSKAAKLRPYYAFFEKNGWYPSPTEVKQAIINGTLEGFGLNDVTTSRVAA